VAGQRARAAQRGGAQPAAQGLGTRIEREDLPPLAGPLRGEPAAAAAAPGTALPEAVREYEKKLVLGALRQSGGVVARAAELLGISRTKSPQQAAEARPPPW